MLQRLKFLRPSFGFDSKVSIAGGQRVVREHEFQLGQCGSNLVAQGPLNRDVQGSSEEELQFSSFQSAALKL
jgi:hypothetical protein